MDSGQWVHLVVMWRDIAPAKLKVKNDTACGFLLVTNLLSTLENLQNDSFENLAINDQHRCIDNLRRGVGVRKGYDPHIGSGGSERLTLIIFWQSGPSGPYISQNCKEINFSTKFPTGSCRGGSERDMIPHIGTPYREWGSINLNPIIFWQSGPYLRQNCQKINLSTKIVWELPGSGSERDMTPHKRDPI